MMDNNYHNGYHDPDCWCYDSHKGGGGNMGCFGTLIITILIFVGSLVLLSLIIAALNIDLEDIPSGVVVFLFIITTSLIAGIISAFKK